MQLSTKSIMSLLSATKRCMKQSHEIGGKQLQKVERLLKCHDRKGTLRASILGIDPITYRREQRQYPLESLVKKYGFKDVSAFLQAVYGKLRHELHCRGWSAKRLQRFEFSAA